MNILPFEKFTIKSKKCSNDLYHSIDQSHEPWKISFNYSRKTKPLFGKRNGNEFKLFRAIKYGNAFLPIAYGKISSDKATSEIIVTLRLSYPVMVFCVIWLLFVLIIAFVILFKSFSFVSLAPLGMFLFGYLLMQIGFWVEAPKIKKILTDISI